MCRIKNILIGIYGFAIFLSCSEDNQVQNGNGSNTDGIEVQPSQISENIVGDWIADYAQDDIDGYRWEILKFHESGIMYFSNYSENKNISHDYVNGEYHINGNTIKTNCQLGWSDMYKTYNADLRVTYIDKYTLVAEILVNNQLVEKNTYLKVLGQINAEHGDTLPDYSNLVGGRKILGYKSHNDYIASVDSISGTISCKWAGSTFIDIITEEGTATLSVRVMDLLNYDFEEYIGLTPQGIAKSFGYLYTTDNNILVYDYNESYYPDLQRESGNWRTMRIRMKYGKVDAITLYAKEDLNMTNDQIVNQLSNHYTLYRKTVKDKNNSEIKETALEKQMNEDIMVFYIGKSLEDAKAGVTWDKKANILRYTNLESYSQIDFGHLIRKTAEQLNSEIGGGVYSYNTGVVILYFLNATYVNKVRVDFRRDGKTEQTSQDIIVYLYDGVDEKIIRNELDNKYVFSYEDTDHGIWWWSTEDNSSYIYYDNKYNWIRYLNKVIEPD